MNIVRKLKKNALDIVISVILFFLSIAMLYPMMYELAVSLSTPESLLQGSCGLLRNSPHCPMNCFSGRQMCLPVIRTR